jgi:tripartite-type tricarboxylate transporter receptor subunit TctC
MVFFKSKFKLIFVIISSFLFSSGAFSSDYPTKPINVMVGYAAGGGTDSYARTLASFIHEHLGMPFMITNKPGASGFIAAKAVADAKSDGYRLYVMAPGPFFIKDVLDGDKAKVKPLEVFRPLGTVGVLNTSLMVPMDSPFKTAKDFVNYYKANPDKVARWANTGNASLHTLGGHAFLQANGIKAQTIPHKGGAKARLSIISKQVDHGFVGIQLLAGFDTKMRPLGALGNTRDPNYPDVPTVEEAGLPPMGIANPMMVWAKKDIPEDAAQKLIVAIKKVAESKGFKKLIKKLGLSAIYASPEESVKLLNDLGAQVTPVAKRVFNK